MKKEPSPLWQYHATFNPGKPFLGCSGGALNSKPHDAKSQSFPAIGEKILPRRATDAEEQGDMNALLSKITLLLLTLALPARAVNIAPGGTGIMGATQPSGSGDNAYYHDGQLAHLCDGNPATRVDNFRQFHEHYHTHGYAGVGWAAARQESVKSVTVTMATFSDFGWFGSREVPPPGSALTPAQVRPDARSFPGSNGGGAIVEPIVQATRSPNPFVTTENASGAGAYSYVGTTFGSNLQTVAQLKVRFATFINGGWFGPTNVGPASGGLITAAHLVEPVVQITVNGGTSWTTVPHTSDYFTALTGHKIGDGTAGNFFSVTISHAATFTLNTPAENINGVRLVGLEGGNAQGFIGVYDFAAFSAAPAPAPPSADPDTDNDGLPDAWEIGKFGNIAAHDADDDPDYDGSNLLLEYAFNMNPGAWDAPPAAVLEGNYLTLTLSKRPLINYSIPSGASLMDFDVAGTTTLINDTTTLKVRDNFPITGPTSRRFMIVRVTALP